MLKTRTPLLLAAVLLSSLTAFAQPSNDECANALTLVMSNSSTPTFTPVSTVGATRSAVAPSCSGTSANDDVWFTFVATSTRATVFYNNFVASGGAATGLGFTLHTACPTTNSATDPVNLFCTFSFGTVAAGGSINTPVGSLIVGNTYVIRFFAQGSASFATFDVGIAQAPNPPANDECAGALSLAVSPASAACTFVPINTANATQSALATTCTTGSNNDDIWYSFVAPSENLLLRYQNFVLSGSASTGLGFSVHSACNGTEIVCDFSFGNASTGFQYLDPSTPLTVGATYFLRLYAQGASNSAAFNFCIQEVVLQEIAARPANACVTTSVNVDGTGGTVAALDAAGDVIAIIGNTQALGQTTVSLYGNAGAVRTYGTNNTPYLDRNITISPSVQPTSPVTVGLPVPIAEISAFYSANGSQTFADYQWARNPATSCSPAFNGAGIPQPFSAVLFYPGGYLFETTVASFSEFFMVPASAPLPVELTRLTAEAAGSRNVVRWAAASEVAFSHYVLERAVRDDLADFASVTEVAARGAASGAEAVYEAYDAAPAAVTYYRLRAVDRDGSAEYSDVVAVRRTDVAGGGGVKVWPNPAAAGGAVSIGLPAGLEEADVFVHDAAGRQVARLRATSTQVDLPLGGLPAGVYAVTARGATASQTVRLVIE